MTITELDLQGAVESRAPAFGFRFGLRLPARFDGGLPTSLQHVVPRITKNTYLAKVVQTYGKR